MGSGWNKIEETIVCATGTCDKATCCAVEVPPCTTVTTTPALTCGSYTCPDGYSANAATTVCQMGKCDSTTCCTAIITTVTTTPAPTCASYFKTQWLPQAAEKLKQERTQQLEQLDATVEDILKKQLEEKEKKRNSK